MALCGALKLCLALCGAFARFHFAAEPQMKARQIATADPEVEDVQAFGDRLHLRVTTAAGPLERLPGALETAGIKLVHLQPVNPTLEDVFMQLLELEKNGS